VHGAVEGDALGFKEAVEQLVEEHADLLAVADDEFVGGELGLDAGLLGEHVEVGADGVGVVLLIEFRVRVRQHVQDPERQVHKYLELLVALVVRRHRKLVAEQRRLPLRTAEL